MAVADVRERRHGASSCTSPNNSVSSGMADNLLISSSIVLVSVNVLLPPPSSGKGLAGGIQRAKKQARQEEPGKQSHENAFQHRDQ